jgi:predicted DCC family thiol-disulfide oxidoreductase YuxK
MTKKNPDHPVIYFDGECNLCSRFVQYVINHDPRGRFRFASLQSDYARSRGFEIPKNSDGSLESMLVEWNGKVLQYSEGALKVLEHLNGLHKLASIGRIFPRAMRDSIYRWIARHRYFFFGKAESCMVPTPELQSRFLG